MQKLQINDKRFLHFEVFLYICAVLRVPRVRAITIFIEQK